MIGGHSSTVCSTRRATLRLWRDPRAPAALDTATAEAYIVQMKHFTASQARQNFSSVLDAAAKGEPVVIERRGLRFVIKAEELKPPKAAARRHSLFEFVDPALESGNWRWRWGAEGGVDFSADDS